MIVQLRELSSATAASRQNDPHPRRIVALRAFPDGRRVHVEAERRVEHRYDDDKVYYAWNPIAWIVDPATGETVTDIAIPWVPPASEIARARAQVSVDEAELRAVSRDGSLLLFVLGRDWVEIADPDAGTVVHCSASIALWDARCHAWRWEVTRTPDEMGGGAWLFGHGSFELSFDESGVFGLVNGQRTSKVFDIADGTLRPSREGDFVPRPPLRSAPSDEVVAGDAKRARAVALRGSLVELWDVAGDRPVGVVDLAPSADEPTAATFIDHVAAVVFGTAQGRLFRFDFE